MKLKLIALVIGATGIVGMSACTKCKICTKTGENEVRLCEKDYNNNTAYGLAVDIYENQDYNCSEAP